MYYRSAVFTVHYITGWKAVEREVKIPHNLDTTPFQIRTYHTWSGERVKLSFYTAGGDYAGSVSWLFTSPPKYFLGRCTSVNELPSPYQAEERKCGRSLNSQDQG